MECIFPQDCNCFDCRFERLEAIFESTSVWHNGGFSDEERCQPYYEDHDEVQDLPTYEDVAWLTPGTLFGDARLGWTSVGTYDPGSPSDQDEDILPF